MSAGQSQRRDNPIVATQYTVGLFESVAVYSKTKPLSVQCQEEGSQEPCLSVGLKMDGQRDTAAGGQRRWIMPTTAPSNENSQRRGWAYRHNMPTEMLRENEMLREREVGTQRAS